MATTSNFVLSKGFPAGGPISKQRFVKFDTNGNIVQCSVSGEQANGVAQFTATASEISLGKGASVMLQGRAILISAEAIAAGDYVSTDASGFAQVANSDDVILGVCDAPAAGANVQCSVELSLTSGATAA
jgi:Uncharacterized conserved protein (DUF2190)